MSCGRTDFDSEHCVSDIVKGIIKAQRKAVDAEERTCLTGCERSIEDLLSPCEDNTTRLKYNTIPFILYCKASCKPFIGSGVHRVRDGSIEKFKCVETPIFRVKSFANKGSNCVRLELLKPVKEKYSPPCSQDAEASEFKGRPPYHHKDCCEKSVCDFFDGHVRRFHATGICITVDLDCFCGISCLDPVFIPLRAAR